MPVRAGCHRDQDHPQWAADAETQVAAPRPARRQEAHFGAARRARAAADTGAALAALARRVAGCPERPLIVRATASSCSLATPAPPRTTRSGTRCRDAEACATRRSARSMSCSAEHAIALVLTPLLGDPTRAVRMEAASRDRRCRRPAGAMAMAAFNAATAEFESAQREDFDRPEAWLNLGNLAGWRGDAGLGAEGRASGAPAATLIRQYVPAAITSPICTGRRGQERRNFLRDGLQAALQAPNPARGARPGTQRGLRRPWSTGRDPSTSRGAPDTSDPSKGLTVTLDERRGVHWPIDPASGNAKRSEPRDSERELQVCAQCHSRAAPVCRGLSRRPAVLRPLPAFHYRGGSLSPRWPAARRGVPGARRQSCMHQAGVTATQVAARA